MEEIKVNPIVKEKDYERRLLAIIKKYGSANIDDCWYHEDKEFVEVCNLINDYFQYLLETGYNRVYLENYYFETYTLDKPVYLDGTEVYIEETYGQGSDIIIRLK